MGSLGSTGSGGEAADKDTGATASGGGDRDKAELKRTLLGMKEQLRNLFQQYQVRLDWLNLVYADMVVGRQEHKRQLETKDEALRCLQEENNRLQDLCQQKLLA